MESYWRCVSFNSKTFHSMQNSNCYVILGTGRFLFVYFCFFVLPYSFSLVVIFHFRSATPLPFFFCLIVFHWYFFERSFSFVFLIQFYHGYFFLLRFFLLDSMFGQIILARSIWLLIFVVTSFSFVSSKFVLYS